MPTFVIVHGAWTGGWSWRPVATALRSARHDVFTPTLTGLGERAHLVRRDVDLSTHIQDVVNVPEYEDLQHVILVGHSYGGMVITGVADRVPERLDQMIYLDAYVPTDGQSMLDCVPAERRALLEEQARALGEGWKLPPAFDEEDWRDRNPQPFRTYQEPLHLTNASSTVPRTFIRCTIDAVTGGKEGPALTAFAPHAARARAEGWRCLELDADHLCHQKSPDGVAGLLHKLV